MPILDDAPVPPARAVRSLIPQPVPAAAVEAQFKNRGGIPAKLEQSAVYIGDAKFYPGSEVRHARRIYLGIEEE